MQKLSVVIPTYRPEEYIYECLQSVARQIPGEIPYRVHIFIILNGDKEPYYSALDDYIIKHSLDASLIYTEQKGVSNARNIGIELSQEFDYVAFIDDDDLIEENYLSVLLKAAEYNLGQLIQCSTKLMFSEGLFSSNHYINEALCKFKNPLGTNKYSHLRYRVFLNSVWAKLFPIEMVRDERFSQRLKISEDALFMFQITPKIQNIVLVNDTAYIIRHREGSATRKQKPVSTILSESFSFIKVLTSTYLASIRRYSFLLYLSRVFASVKFIIIRLVKQKKIT